MGLFDKFHEATNYVFVHKRGEESGKKQDLYDMMGAMIVECVGRIESCISKLEAQGCPLPDIDAIKAKNAETLEFVKMSTFDESTFSSWGIDEDSVWMKDRRRVVHETGAREKQISLVYNRALSAQKEKQIIMAWPLTLAEDVSKLTQWMDEVSVAINSLQNYVKENVGNKWVSSIDLPAVERELQELREASFEWTRSANAFARQASEVTAQDMSAEVSPFKALLAQTEQHRAMVKKSLESKSKVTTLMSKIRKIMEDINGLNEAAPVFQKLQAEVNKMILENRNSPMKNARVLSSHGKFRCQKALERAASMQLTGDPSVDYKGVARCVQELKEAQRAAKEPYGGYYQ